MLITLLTSGSRGDIQPYIALGVALKHAGQRVRLATFENYASFVSEHDLEFFPVTGDVSSVTSSGIVNDAMQADNPLKVALSFNKLNNLIFDLQKDYYAACQGSDAILYHPGVPLGYFTARQMNIATVLATPFPMSPTREFPALIFSTAPRLKPGLNLLTHRIFSRIMWSASSSPVAKFWKATFGRLPADFGSPFGTQGTRSQPTVISCSSHVFPRPQDWSPFIHMSGYWFLEEQGDWQPSTDLQEFLDRGTPPVYVGFGSVGDPSLADQTTQLVLEALQLSGQRGVLATGWSSLSVNRRSPPGIFVLQSVPHTWLFPRMSAVVHHGGAGTTAAGLCAGVPQVIIPHSNDQFAWGKRVYELGVGAKPIPRKRLTSHNLAVALDAVSAPGVKDAARDLGQMIQAENGATVTAQFILDYLKNPNSLYKI